MTTVSYLIVAYKSRESIGATIDAIVAQQGEFEQEIIVVDNYPQGSSADLVLARCPQARITINDRNLGYTRGVNQAIARAGGDYLFLLNPDVILDRHCTDRLLEAINAETDLVAAAPKLRLTCGEVQMSIRNFPTFSTLLSEISGSSPLLPISKGRGDWRNRSFDYGKRGIAMQPMASALLLRRDAVAALGPWDEQFFVFFSDVDYCRRIHDGGHRIIYDPTATVEHLGGGATRQEGSWLIYDSHVGFYSYLCKHELVGGRRWLRVPALLLLLWGAVLRDVKRRLLRLLF